MLDIAQYYSVPPHYVYRYSTRQLSLMVTAMESNKAKERIKRIEEIHAPYMKEGKRDKFLNSIYKQIDPKYRDERMVEEDELKRILGNVGNSLNN